MPGWNYSKGLRNLQSLDLCQTGVTDAGLQRLGGLKNLHSLNLKDTKVAGTGLKHSKRL